LLESDHASAPTVDASGSRHLNEFFGKARVERSPRDSADLEAEGFVILLEKPIGMLLIHSAHYAPTLNLGHDHESHRLGAIFGDVIRRVLGQVSRIHRGPAEHRGVNLILDLGVQIARRRVTLAHQRQSSPGYQDRRYLRRQTGVHRSKFCQVENHSGIINPLGGFRQAVALPPHGARLPGQLRHSALQSGDQLR
jgi:hypothetical protein